MSIAQERGTGRGEGVYCFYDRIAVVATNGKSVRCASAGPLVGQAEGGSGGGCEESGISRNEQGCSRRIAVMVCGAVVQFQASCCHYYRSDRQIPQVVVVRLAWL